MYTWTTAKKRVENKRLELQNLNELKAAMLIQRSWRGGRGRYFAMLQRKLAKLRTKEGRAATMIQKCFRGARARQNVRTKRRSNAEESIKEAGVVKIQKIFRGHKGRERAEVEHVLSIARAQVRDYATAELAL